MNRPPMSSLTRRDFLRLSAGAAVGAGFASRLPAATEAAPPAFRLRYVLSMNLFGCLPVAETIPQWRAAGAEALDIWAGRWGNTREQVDALGHEKFAALLAASGATVGTYTCMD